MCREEGKICFEKFCRKIKRWKRVYFNYLKFIFSFVFFLLFHLLLSVREFASFIYNFLYILVCILLLLHVWHLVLLSGSGHLVLLHHCLLLDGRSVLLLGHLVLLLVVLWCILNNMSILTRINFSVTFHVWHPVFWWWNVLALVSIIELNSLYKKDKSYN